MKVSFARVYTGHCVLTLIDFASQYSLPSYAFNLTGNAVQHLMEIYGLDDGDLIFTFLEVVLLPNCHRSTQRKKAVTKKTMDGPEEVFK